MSPLLIVGAWVGANALLFFGWWGWFELAERRRRRRADRALRAPRGWMDEPPDWEWPRT